MAVSLNMNAVSAMKKIGVASEALEWLGNSGVAVKLTANAFVFTSMVDGQNFSSALPVTLSFLQALNADKAVAHEKAKLALQLFEKIIKFKDLAKSHKLEKPDAATGTLSKLPPLTVTQALGEPMPEPAFKVEEPKMAVPIKPAPWQPLPIDKAKTAPCIKLAEATALYQPVLGTSGGSRYYMVAANKDIRIAARLQGTTLSVRVEGPLFGKYLPRLQKAGFDNGSAAKGYASMHLDAGEKALAYKTLGAILAGLNIPLETPMPQLQLIYGD